MNQPTLPSSDGFPRLIKYDGRPLGASAGQGTPLHIPGHPGWKLEVYRHNEPGFVSHVWYRPPDVGLAPVPAHISVFNWDTTGPPKMLRVDGAAVPISPLSGGGWSASSYGRWQSTPEVNPWESFFIDALVRDRIDARVTRYTGSSTTEFFCPPGLWAERGPVSPVVGFVDETCSMVDGGL